MTSLLQSQRAVNLNKIPDQTGKVFVVTGGNIGLGYEVAKALAASNAHVFMTARNPEKQRGSGSFHLQLCIRVFKSLSSELECCISITLILCSIICRAIQRIKSDHPGAKIEGLHVDYLNGFG